MAEKKIKPTLISRIQDRRGKTIFNVENRLCEGCDKFINDSKALPQIKNTNSKVLSEETAYQMTMILKGAVERGTAKKIKIFKSPSGRKNRHNKR